MLNTFSSQDLKQDALLNEQYNAKPTCLADISNSGSSSSFHDIRGRSVMVNEATEPPIATPSLATSSISNTLSLLADQQCHNGQVWTDVDQEDGRCTSENNEVQSGIQNCGRGGAACVILQVMDINMRSHGPQKAVGRARLKLPERKGVTDWNSLYFIVHFLISGARCRIKPSVVLWMPQH